ncbi:hypothetical protein ASG49_11340 [Marmoricola sp. Leaf446]|uniref:DUF6752 domain-containing protein n=1 Tax=Marmoricola sp. Leaf446 TaxID=1736379 RepID=UPI0006F2CAE6|nr:DUF6752 domain-containing protein [Marmoricola sp. Leaf446]KQT91593.1 hypothetical protein ASG49_11340 [Marmoricola sp. Leaf446]
MTERVYLHVGGPKSGTTYLQSVLRQQRDRLAEAGVLVAGEAQVQLVHAAMVLRDDRRLDDLPPRARDAWKRLVEEIRQWQGPTAVVSYELLSNLTAEQVARAVDDLSGLEVHVVVTARDLGRVLSSAWQERLKFGLRDSLEAWQVPDESVVASEWGWRTLDPASVAARWGSSVPAHRLHLVTVPREKDAGGLWHRFADACGLPPELADAHPARANESLAPAAAEVLRRVNPHLDDFLRTGRERAVWSRDLLANQVLARLGREPIRATDVQLEQARSRHAGVVAAVEQAGYVVHGDLADLAPTAGAGRSPGDVTEGEVLDTALRTIAALLEELRVRDAAQRPSSPPTGPRQPVRSPLRRAGAVAAGLASRPLLDRNARLHARIDELEARLDDRRRLQQRLAALTDLVAELLLPTDAAGEAEIARLLETYRRTTV